MKSAKWTGTDQWCTLQIASQTQGRPQQSSWEDPSRWEGVGEVETGRKNKQTNKKSHKILDFCPCPLQSPTIQLPLYL